MDIPVSLCNVFPGRPVLCLADTATSAVRVVPVPGEHTKYNGVRGLWISEQYLYLVRQEATGVSPPELLMFDRSSFDLLTQYVFRSTGNVHSIWGSDGVLYAISTGTDEVLKLEMQGPEVISETVIWRLERERPRSDMHHLNAICARNGDLLVSGFGKRSGTMWTSASDGFIFNVTHGEKLAGGVNNPHSLALVGDTVVYCESKTRTVRLELAKREVAEAVPAGKPSFCSMEDAWGLRELLPGRPRVAFLARDRRYWVPAGR